MRRRLPVLVVMLFAASTAKAQSSPPPDQAEQVRMLLERVQRLERRLAEMETKLAAASAPLELAANVPAAPKPELAEAAPSPGPGHQHEGRDEQTAVRQMETHYPSLQIRGFGDVDFRPIAAALKEVGYNGVVSVEVFDFTEGPEVIATKSLEYLKKVFHE